MYQLNSLSLIIYILRLTNNHNFNRRKPSSERPKFVR